HRQVRAAVITVVECDDGLASGVLAGDLDRVLDCLCARVEQCALLREVARGEPVERFGDLDVRLVGRDHETGVRELRRLGRYCGCDLGMRVADGGDGDAAAEVDERVAVSVHNDATTGGDGGNRDSVPDAGRNGIRFSGED